MQRYILSIFLAGSMLLTGCASQDSSSTGDQSLDPVALFAQAEENMKKVETLKLDGEASIEGELLGKNISYQMTTQSQSKLDNGTIVESYMDTTVKENEKAETSKRVYINENQFGTYNEETDSWEIKDIGAENQSLASLFQSSFDPATMLLDNSEMKSEIEIIGKETINGVQTIGLSVQMDADSLQHVIEPMIESAAGDASDFVTSIAGEFLNNIEREYWIGEDDKLIHAMKLHLSTPFGDFNLNVTVYDYNESFEIPVNAEQITEN